MEFSPYQFYDRFFFIACAMLANAVILGHPVIQKIFAMHRPQRFLHWVLRLFEHKLNRPNRSASERKTRGAIMILGMLFLCGIVAASLSALTAVHHLAWMAEVFLLALFLPLRQLYHQAKQWQKSIHNKDYASVRNALARYTHRETSKLDAAGLNRTIIEYLAKAFSDRIVSPIFWYAILGLPGFVASRILTEAGLLMGYPSKRHRAFGALPGGLERGINALPSLIAGYLLALAALFTPAANPAHAFKLVLSGKGKIHSPQKRAPLAAAAGALGLSLGGPHSVQRFLMKDDWIGKGSAKISAVHLRKFLLQYAIACLLILALLATLLLI